MLTGASAHTRCMLFPLRERELNQVPAITRPYSFPFRFTLPKSAFCICKEGVTGGRPSIVYRGIDPAVPGVFSFNFIASAPPNSDGCGDVPVHFAHTPSNR
jgi:hypothetical protein